MEPLAQRIDRELARRTECGIYEDVLSIFWPLPDAGREDKIKRFATDHGFRLRFYREGLCAIFDRSPPLDGSKDYDSSVKS